DERDFTAVLSLCGQYAGYPFFASLKAEAESGERAARVAEVERQVDEESDLMRQIELLDATMRFYPDEVSLLERSRVAKSKLGEVDGIVAKAREAEKMQKWDEALAQWAAVGQTYKDYPGLAQEVERVSG